MERGGDGTADVRRDRQTTRDNSRREAERRDNKKEALRRVEDNAICVESPRDSSQSGGLGKKAATAKSLPFAPCLRSTRCGRKARAFFPEWRGVERVGELQREADTAAFSRKVRKERNEFIKAICKGREARKGSPVQKVILFRVSSFFGLTTFSQFLQRRS